MTTGYQRHQILTSLESMDQAQVEKVLHYMRGLLSTKPRETSGERLKIQALREIQQALQEGRA